MRSADDIKKQVEKLEFKAGAKMRKRVLDDVLKAQKKSKTTSPAHSGSEIWRIIMHSKISKFAVAVVIIAVAVLSITFLNKTATVAYAMTDVPELFRQANVVHVKGLQHYNLTDKGQKVSPQPIERWIDLENGRFRFSTITVNAGPEEVNFKRKETISDGQYKMVLNHANRSAIFYKMSDLQRTTQTNASLNHLFCSKLFPDADILKEFSIIGEEKIDGVMYNIWECEVQKSPGRKNLYRYWLSITGNSGRFQSWYKNIPQPFKIVDKTGKEHLIPVNNSQSQPEWRLGFDVHKIECNVPIPENVFKLEVPEGYEAKNTKENAIYQELGAHRKSYLGKFKLKPRISFTLSDGSVILAWHSEDGQSPAFQNELFEDLEFGGALPKLPVEITALKPVGWTWTGRVKYLGRHLAYTQKNGKFIEWGLYVPNNSAPNLKQILGYDVIYTFNFEKKPKTNLSFMVDYGISIETSDDFDMWVLGAMEELSDTKELPEISYESVLKLAEDIRSTSH